MEKLIRASHEDICRGQHNLGDIELEDGLDRTRQHNLVVVVLPLRLCFDREVRVHYFSVEPDDRIASKDLRQVDRDLRTIGRCNKNLVEREAAVATHDRL